MPVSFLNLRTLRVEPPLILAPMTGLTHTAFRHLAADFGGCGLFYTEMLSARSLAVEAADSSPWLAQGPGDRPIIYQLLISHPEEFAPALETVQACGADGIDLNMGCTASLIIKRGGGIALMKDPARAKAIVAAARRRTNLPLLAKIRLGWALDWKILSGFCLMLQESGVDAVVVHPRLKQDRLKRPARWEYIARAKELLRIPVIGNGDVDSPAAASRMFRQTGCDAVMMGRAAVTRPWLFRDIAAALWGDPPIPPEPQPPEVFHRFLVLLERTVPPAYRLSLLSRFTVHFARNYSFGHTLWRVVHASRTVAEAAARADLFFRSQHPHAGLLKNSSS
jgi:tRNA-dihydrouridine synthase B